MHKIQGSYGRSIRVKTVFNKLPMRCPERDAHEEGGPGDGEVGRDAGVGLGRGDVWDGGGVIGPGGGARGDMLSI